MIWRCTVTSRPVVGSSSTTSAGLQASAMAMATRCCWPPESWCGKRRRAAAGSGRPTFARSSVQRAAIGLGREVRCGRAGSRQAAAPMRIDGLSAVVGFCGTKPIRPPRRRCRAAAGQGQDRVSLDQDLPRRRPRIRRKVAERGQAKGASCPSRFRRQGPAPRRRRCAARRPSTARAQPASVR